RIWKELDGAHECAERVVRSPGPIVGRSQVTPIMSIIRTEARCTLVERNAGVQVSSRSIDVCEGPQGVIIPGIIGIELQCGLHCRKRLLPKIRVADPSFPYLVD